MKQTEKALSGGMDRPSPAGAGNTGTKTEDLKQLDENALNQPELISTVEDRLNNLGEMLRPERGTRKNPAAEVEDEDEPGEGEEDGKPKETSDKPPADKPSDADPPILDDKKGLPEPYVRAAVMYGWKREDAIEFYEADPERALTTFSNIYQTRNKASAEFAALGRKAKEQPPKTGEDKPPFEPIDTAKLREKYGEEAEPLIAMLEAQNKSLNQLAERLPKAPKQEAKAFESAVEESGVEQQIHQYYESDAMKPWGKVYGKLEFGQTWDDLPAGAREHRYRLLTIADQIAGGAQLQGTRITLGDALEMAHLLVTQKYRDQVLIDGVKAKVVERSKSLTLKPSKGTKKPGKDVTEPVKPGNRTKEQLVADTQRKLTKLFGG